MARTFNIVTLIVSFIGTNHFFLGNATTAFMYSFDKNYPSISDSFLYVIEALQYIEALLPILVSSLQIHLYNLILT